MTRKVNACIIIPYSETEANGIKMIKRYIASQKRQKEVADPANIRKPVTYMVLFDSLDDTFELYTRGEWFVQHSTWVQELMWDEDADHSDEEVVEAICGDEVLMIRGALYSEWAGAAYMPGVLCG